MMPSFIFVWSVVMSDKKKDKPMAQTWWYITLTIITLFVFFPLGLFMVFCIYFSGKDKDEQ